MEAAAFAVPAIVAVAAVRKFEDLICWQVSAELRDTVFSLTDTGAAARDTDFKDQIRRSSRSAAANLSEGFAAFYPREFARLARIARRSLVETRNHLYEGRKRKYFAEPDLKRLIHLTFRAQKATTGLIKYLDSCKGRSPGGWNFRQN